MDTKDPVVQPAPDLKAQKKKKRKKKRIVRKIIAIVIVLAIIGGIAFGMYTLFKKPAEGEKEIMSGFVYMGSIQSMVTGSGVTKPNDSTTIVLSASGTVQEVFVQDGDWVNIGDPLYVIDSTEAKEAVEAAQETLDGYQEQMDALMASYNNLTITAPFAGKLMDVSELRAGDNIGSGSVIATLVDDSVMELTLYFSYAYESSIYVGQSATVTVPSSMAQVTGSVKEISYVDFVSAEGGRFFEVVLSVPNPGTFTEGTAASALLTAADGSDIYPYNSDVLKFARKVDVTSRVHGEITYANLKNYLRVGEGAVLVTVAAGDMDAEIAALKATMQVAQEKYDEAVARLDDFSAVSPMNGTVLSCALQPGMEVTAGFTAVSIADTSTMTVEARIDEMNIAYVKPGMMVDVYQYGRNGQEYFMGTVSTVSMEGKFENGFSYFPAVITVDNPTGTLMSGMYIDYSLLASQSDNCLLAPVQAVKYTEQGTCLFIRADSAPENALDAETLGIEVPEGYYAVPVTVGLSDNTNAEIVEGVEEGTEVFMQYMTNQAYGGW